MKHNILYRNLTRAAAAMLLAGAVTACGDDDIDNTYSRNQSVIQLGTSSEYVVLDENNPDAVALTIEWNPANHYGNEYITTYQYEMTVSGSKGSAIKEYEDDGVFHREYTNRELQEMLIGRFGCLTSSISTFNLTVTASFEGPRVVIPDIATATVRVKTYGPKQFLADAMSVGGTAVGDTPIALTPTSANSGIYTWTGALKAGKINFPVVYGDENNALSPSAPDTAIGEEEMSAEMVDASESNYWVVPADDNYRITINLNTRTVKIVPAGSIIELDHLYMAGAAVGSDEIEITRTLEAEDLYAWRGELKAGKLYMPLEYQESKAVSFVPKAAGDHDIHDGQPHAFTQVATEAGTGAAYWEIPADGTYRIVVNTTEHTVTIYSAATDLKNTTVTYNNTVVGNTNFSQEVTELWMYGGFNNWAKESGLYDGFQSKYSLKQSLANPNVFVYSGADIERYTITDSYDKQKYTGPLNFKVANFHYNVYAYASTAPAIRNQKNGYTQAALGETLTLVAGQGDNRFAFFCIPEGCNFIVVDIEKLTVVFDKK